MRTKHFLFVLALVFSMLLAACGPCASVWHDMPYKAGANNECVAPSAITSSDCHWMTKAYYERSLEEDAPGLTGSWPMLYAIVRVETGENAAWIGYIFGDHAEVYCQDFLWPSSNYAVTPMP